MSRSPRPTREERLQAAEDQLTDAVGRLVTSEDWVRAMQFAAQFRSRSFNNTLLIWAQHLGAYEQGRVPEPTPTYVAGYRTWLRLGRQVQAGQPGYVVLAPVTGRFSSATPEATSSWRRLGRGERPEPGESVNTRLVGVRPAYVWDASQTAGDPIPTHPAPRLLEGQAPEGLWDGLAKQIEDHGFGLRLVSNATAIGGANGLTDFTSREVSVRMDMDDAAQTKTLAHELAHVLLHGPNSEDAFLHRGIAEVEAESIALMIGAVHGLDTSSYTVPYVASWSESVPGRTPTEVIHETAERVRGTALRVLVDLPTQQTSDGNPPGLDALQTRSAPTIDAPRRVVATEPRMSL